MAPTQARALSFARALEVTLSRAQMLMLTLMRAQMLSLTLSSPLVLAEDRLPDTAVVPVE